MFSAYPVVLASASPRRQELLKSLVAEFVVVAADLDEDALTTSNPYVTAESLALSKAKLIAESYPGHLVIGGDTVVAIPEGDGFRQLAKPLDEADAARMLRLLSGKTHRVITGIAIVFPGGEASTYGETHVSFREITDAEIATYVATGEPLDKAGSYGIQGLARSFVARIDGTESNVIGLPLEELERLLSRVHA